MVPVTDNLYKRKVMQFGVLMTIGDKNSRVTCLLLWQGMPWIQWPKQPL